MADGEQQRGPAARQPVMPAAPQFPRRKSGIGRRQHRDENDPVRHRAVEGGQAAGDEPDQTGRERIAIGRVAPVETAQAAPDRSAGREQERIGDIDAEEIGNCAAGGEQCAAERARAVSGRPPSQCRDGAALRPSRRRTALAIAMQNTATIKRVGTSSCIPAPHPSGAPPMGRA